MSKDTENKLNGQSGEITTIREILMGSQLGAYEKRFAALEQRLSEIEAKLNQSNDKTTKHIDQLSTSLKSDFSTRIANIENQFKENSNNDRKELGKLFSEISDRLLKS